MQNVLNYFYCLFLFCCSPVQPMFTEYKECHQHTSLVTILSGIIQAITLRCPTALIWSVTKISSPANDPMKPQTVGSPLDKLPCAPSDLIIGCDDEDRKDTDEVYLESFNHLRPFYSCALFTHL